MVEGSKSEKGRDVTITENEIHAAKPRLRGRKLTAALAFVAGTGFTLFGYVRFS